MLIYVIVFENLLFKKDVFKKYSYIQVRKINLIYGCDLKVSG